MAFCSLRLELIFLCHLLVDLTSSNLICYTVSHLDSGLILVKMAPFNKKIDITDTKSVCVTPFKKRVWIHFRDDRKNKSVSFSEDDFCELLQKLKTITKQVKQCKKSIKMDKKQKKSSKKIKLANDSSSSSSDDTTGSDSD